MGTGMSEPKPQNEVPSEHAVDRARVFNALRRPLALTRAGMFAERLARSFWPLWSWMFALWSALAFGIADNLTVEFAYMGAIFGLSVALVLLVMGLHRFRWVTFSAAIDRLDRSLEDRPLAAIMDTQSVGANDAASIGVWRAHLERTGARLMKARAVLPVIRLSKADPFALRYVAATAFILSLAFGTVAGRDTLRNALLPPDLRTTARSGPLFEGWIEPPRYTGLPTIYLNKTPQNPPLAVPVGSKVMLRLYGQNAGSGYSETVSGRTSAGTSESTRSATEFKVAKSGDVQIDGTNGAPQIWRITAIPDRAPMIAITGPIQSTLQGEINMPFSAADDYGIASGTVTISLDLLNVARRYGLTLPPESAAPIILDIPLPFSGGTKDFSDVIKEDLSKNPWVGLPVIVTLSALDDRGQTGQAEPEMLRLPGRHFFIPLAKAIAEQRRDLLWNRKNAPRVAMVLRAITNLPEDIFDNPKAYLMVRTAITRLEINQTPDLPRAIRDDVAELLWQAALQVEDGDLSDAQKRLRRAQDRLSQALKNGASNKEIARLSDALRKAMQDYLNQLAQNAAKNPDKKRAQNGNMREITSDQLQAMLDRIEKLSRQGRLAEAQQLLEQLSQLMENMQMARRQPGQGQGQGQHAMRGLQDTLRQQQRLSDDAFRKLQDQFNGQGSSQEKKGAGDLAGRQQALRKRLEQQQKDLAGGQASKRGGAREALGKAGRKMGEARDALKNGDIPGALDRQAEALDALREGIDGLGRELAKNQSQNVGQQGNLANGPDSNARRDPLGRHAGSLGQRGSDSTLLPHRDLYRRSRELVDEIRRRSGDRSRSRMELDYLQRLLDRF